MLSIQSVMSMFTGPLSALILHLTRDDPIQIESWRWLLIIEGAPAVLIAMLVWSFLPNSPLQCERFLNQKEQRWMLNESERFQRARNDRNTKLASSGSSAASLPSQLWTLLRDARVVLVSTAMMINVCAFWGINFFKTIVLKGENQKRSIALIALVEAVPQAIISLGQLAWSWHSDKTEDRLVHISIGLLAVLIGYMLSMFVVGADGVSFVVEFAVLSLPTIFTMVNSPVIRAYQTDFMPKNAAALGFGCT